jgi:hypothetical protein
MVLLPRRVFGPSIALLPIDCFVFLVSWRLPLCDFPLEELPMEWIRRVFHVPATETQTGIVLALCIFAMSVMSIVLVWQAQVIAKQNAVIHMFESRLGS